ncbi:hypothetical protein DL93DRAFT_2077013 [Clavulina sp. PMI_390]|nr:hypothetical protein DL93DRAFT_2077013 [Clavulina sp. PMI_390]
MQRLTGQRLSSGSRASLKARVCTRHLHHSRIATSTATPLPTPLRLNSTVDKDSPIFFPHDSILSDPIISSSPAPFLFYPAFLSGDEQRVLLQTSLQKLDSSLTPSREIRRKRKEWRAKHGSAPHVGFLPDDYYDFEEGHYDGVINNYREMHLTSWPDDMTIASELGPPPETTPLPSLSSIVDRLRSLFLQHAPPAPSSDSPSAIQTHLLHLSSTGAIGPHVDNIGASGSIIMGVSLGSPRILRLVRRPSGSPVHLDGASGRHVETSRAGSGNSQMPMFEALLLPGSVYIQRDAVRYEFDHSVLPRGMFRGQTIDPGQRVSIMMRDQNENSGGL